MSERSVEHVTFVLERTYDASPDRVFAAWSDPEAKARWFDGSDGEFELDFRVGGWERGRGMLPHGREYTFRALYQDIVPGRRIVYTYDMLLDGTRAPRLLRPGLGAPVDTGRRGRGASRRRPAS
jgi:uncharacterized protein YndB with AHSA1/START domain